ncbi:MAG: hypothetical protein H7831_05585 [Magnetococcus sp. WYHC-3]
MKTIMTLALLAGCWLLASAAMAENAQGIDLNALGESIRAGKVDVGKQLDMHKTKGRFHLIHSETVGIECESCHVGPRHAPDYLLLNRHNAEQQALGNGKGPKSDVTDRTVCLGCHKTKGAATAWYRTVTQ